MENRKERPNLSLQLDQGTTSDSELFQNKVLRPIIKMQSDLCLIHLGAKLHALKIDFKTLNTLKQIEVLTKIFSKDLSFKREIIGIIIGQFSIEEYKVYSTMVKEANRRITQIVLNRCIDVMTLMADKKS